MDAATIARILMRTVKPQAALPKPSVAPGIRAYHGSPYDFDKFDLSKVGTGEGAQSYGHGLYFAENPKVADSYKRDLLMNKFVHGKNWNPVQEEAATRFYANGQDHTKAMKDLADRITDTRMYADSPESLKQLNESYKLLASGWKPPGGNMYEVNIRAKPEQFLDWDRPLSQQSSSVRLPIEDTAVYRDRLRGHEAGKLRNPQELTGSQWTSFLRDEPALRSAGSERPLDASGLRKFPYDGPKQPFTESYLRNQGIPGIRYLDQGSRGPTNWVARHPKGGTWEHPSEQEAKAFIAKNPEYSLEVPKQTSNYVVFDPSIVDIMKKYGIAVPGATAFGAIQSDNAQAAPQNNP